MRVYLASSWRNPDQPAAVQFLRDWGHEVYDFRNPTGTPDVDTGFQWSSIDKDWQNWTAHQFRDALNDPIAVAGFNSDFNAMKWCDACVMLMPCGSSAHLELGWAAGADKHTAIVMSDGKEPELMIKVADALLMSIKSAAHWLDELEKLQRTETVDDVENCRVCGCTDLTACVGNDGLPCFWVEPGLCSACNLLQMAG